jgi:hypothetical protein
MKTKIIIAIAISLLSSIPFIVHADDIMMQTYRAEAIAMDQANECRRAIATYDAKVCKVRRIIMTIKKIRSSR